MDALPTNPVSLPISEIRDLRPAKTWKTWDRTVEIRTASDDRIAVRGTLDEVVNKLNGFSGPFALTPREERLHRMREDGYSLGQRALSFNTTALRIAKEEAVIEKKLEAAGASRRSPPKDEFADAPHNGAGRAFIHATEETLAMMRDENTHPDATT